MRGKVFYPELAFWKYVLLIVGSHWLIDVGKAYLSPTLWAFLLDQLLHFVILFLVATNYLPQKAMPLQYLDILPDIFLPGLLLAVLFCMKPTNILIKLILERYQIGEASSCQDIKNAGGLIGNLERMLTLLFVLIGQFEAIGFIVASCKSFLTDGYRGERQVLVQNVGIVDRLVEHTVDVDFQHTVLFAAAGDGVP